MSEQHPVIDLHTVLIRQAYRASAGDSTALFQALLHVAEEVGMEAALRILEGCVTEKRLSWLNRALPRFARTSNPLADAFRLFYVDYLGLSIPRDGELVESSSCRLAIRWWNPCPTLEACRRFGLDTRTVCRLAYHSPVQAFLEAVGTRLRFDRNYASLRPHAAYCEEIITLEEPAPPCRLPVVGADALAGDSEGRW